MIDGRVRHCPRCEVQWRVVPDGVNCWVPTCGRVGLVGALPNTTGLAANRTR